MVRSLNLKLSPFHLTFKIPLPALVCGYCRKPSIPFINCKLITHAQITPRTNRNQICNVCFSASAFRYVMSRLEIKDAHTILTPCNFTLSIKHMSHVGNPYLLAKSFGDFHFSAHDTRDARLHYLLTECRLYTDLPGKAWPCQAVSP